MGMPLASASCHGHFQALFSDLLQGCIPDGLVCICRHLPPNFYYAQVTSPLLSAA